MTHTGVARRRSALTVSLLTIMWVLAMLTLAWWWFGIGMAQWADQSSTGGDNSTELDRQAAATELWLAFVAVGGALLIATVAFATRLLRTGTVYAVLALVLGVLALPAAASAHRRLTPPAPPSSTPAICQEHSGGGNECPGN